jgi:ribonucleoside-diphosphate reductase alpha chain
VQDLQNTNTIFTNDFSREVWESTYKYHTDNSVDDTILRVAKDLASIENDPEYWTAKFQEMLSNFAFVPGGRITSNAGTGLKGTTYLNCFVSGPGGVAQDSMEGIFRELRHLALILKSEGGYGINADFMRPRGAFIEGIGVESPGAVKMLDMWNTISSVITEGSGKKKKTKEGKNKIRKGAMMTVLSIWHPAIEEFIVAKQTEGVLSKFNMSVGITDDFMNAVENNLPTQNILVMMPNGMVI